jgi:hypothetical protein
MWHPEASGMCAAHPVLVVEAVCVIADFAGVVAAQLAVLEAAANEPAAAATAAAAAVVMGQRSHGRLFAGRCMTWSERVAHVHATPACLVR